MSARIDVAVIMGTRPEAIKLAPVVHALREVGLRVRIIATGQHRELFDGALDSFGLDADVNLRVMKEDQDLTFLTSSLLVPLKHVLEAESPRFVLVQGDATSCLAGALACFYSGIPCGHVEAGLRTGNRRAPWPEEINRRLTDQLCTRHYAPTSGAKENLLREGLDASSVVVTGQTGVDAALMIASRVGDGIPRELAALPIEGKRLVYATGHRRESFNGGIRNVAMALRAIAQERPDVHVVFAAHPNPNVVRELSGAPDAHERLSIIRSVSYPASIWLIKHAEVIVSDSGGIQEEAPCFGARVLVTRDVTERPEGKQAGFLKLVGTTSDVVLRELRGALDDPGHRDRLRAEPNPYGDGRASARIAEDIKRLLEESTAR